MISVIAASGPFIECNGAYERIGTVYAAAALGSA
jgi:hypothetical protein